MFKKQICLNCGSTAVTKTITPGSFFIELILWCLFIVPGLVYSIWRVTNRYKVCKICGSKNLVPLNSPLGQEMLLKIKKATEK